MSEPGKAVFLSYASQDAEAAKRICDALRAANIEVWFDQSELVGGDVWDQKIRGQIAECALFVPLISANTQARLEGYFRREWKQAAARTHDMADEKTFLLPVVIDDTKDAIAKVPPEFKAVQWTRLPAGEASPAFVSRVKKLLFAEGGDAAPAPAPVLRPPSTVHRKSRLWWLAPVFGVTMALLLVLRDKSPAPAAATPAVSAPAAASADALITQARALLDDPLMTRANVELAEQLGLEALAKEPMSAEANALVAWTNYLFLFENYDKSPQRLADLKRYADKALLLAPNSVMAELAACGVLVVAGDAEEVSRRLQALADRHPDNLLVLRTWAWTAIWGRGSTWGVGRDDEHPAVGRLRALSPLGRAYADSFAAGRAWGRGNYAEADRLIESVFASGQPVRLTYLVRLLVLTFGWGDLPAAREFAKTIPAKLLLEDVFINHVSMLWIYSGENDQALATLNRASRPMLHEARVVTPTAELRGRALAAAGRTASAALQWNEVLKVVGQRLEQEPDNDDLRASKVLALARLNDLAAARKEFALVEELRKAVPGNRAWAANFDLAMEIGDVEGALARFDRAIAADNPRWPNAYNLARYDPLFAPLRTDSRMQPILARAEKWLAQMRAKPAGEASGTAKAPDEKSVAVLAFANLSDDKANEYFSDGISEELLNVLAKVPKLRVSARTSSFYFKGRNEPIPEIARKLGVAYVVEGSVRKAGNKVRITAQLIKAADGFHVWSETYDRDLTDIFAVQDEIARNILGVVKGSVLGDAELPHTQTTKIEAYTLFLQAQGAFAKRGEANLREAIRLHEAALAIDPDYVPALAGKAQAGMLLPIYAFVTGTKARELTSDALRSARRALALDPQNTTALAVVSWSAFQFDWQWDEGLTGLLRVRDLAPNDSWAWNCLGDAHRYTGNFVEALKDKQRAWELDPLSPVTHWDISYSYLVGGRYAEAIQWSHRTIDLAPRNLDSYICGLLASARAGQFDEMHRLLAAARQNMQEAGGMLELTAAHCAIMEKNLPEARRCLAQAAALSEKGQVPPGYLGYLYLLVGETDQARVWLQRGCEVNDPSLTWTEQVDLDVIAANPLTRPILDQSPLKELREIRQRNARAGLSKL